MSPMNPRLLRPIARFSPLSLAGLALWLDGADAASLGNDSSGAGGAFNNGPVRYWADKSGNNRHATNTGADSVCPTFLVGAVNGLNAIGFDGGDDIGASQGWAITSQTTFAVARMSSAATGFGRIFSQSDASPDFSTTGHYIPLLRSGSTSNIGSYIGSTNRAPVAVSLNAWFVASSRHTGAQVGNSMNGGAEVVASVAALNKTFTRYNVGASFGAFGDGTWADRIAEVIVYNRALSDSERQSVVQYLGAKWGIAVA